MLQIPAVKLKELVLQEGLSTPEVFDVAAKEAERLGQGMADVLISRGIISNVYYYQMLSRYLGVPLASLESNPIDPGVLNLLPKDLASQRRIILFGKEEDGAIKAAMEDPGDLVALEFLEQYLKARIRPYLGLDKDLNKGFALYSQGIARDYKKLIEENISASIKNRIKGEQGATEVPIVGIVDNLMSYAAALRASDVHIEVFEDTILVRYRIDGMLYEMFRIPKEIHPAIVARFKLLGGLKIDEHYRPQDGRFRQQIGNDNLDIRESVMPTFYGEKVQMRLLPSTNRPLSFTELGMLDETAKVLAENIKKSYGMILVCGPTGSGKSTTLYSVLGILNRPEVNIVTVEDPIEYDMKFVNQTQINPQAGITFANGLRAILRQDPNIIMVGEIRDIETAEIAVQSALTGHLVLSSLHTNDAPTAIPRFIDLNIPPFLVAAVLNAVLSQRLVRKVCGQCIYSFEPSEEVKETVRRQVRDLGIENFKMPDRIYAGKGCSVCGGSGYRGRLGIYEVLNVSEDVRQLIISREFSLDNLRTIARKEGMVTMFEDGLHKVERGATTIEELLRVIRE
jgi:type IV pilus assembly protein PilB